MVWIATRGDQPPLASIPRVTPGPTASRTARTLATSPSGSIPTLTFITVKPWLTAQAAISAARGAPGRRRSTWWGRTPAPGPPGGGRGGSPAACPRMSQQAISNPALVKGLAARTRRKRAGRRSMARGSCPTRAGSSAVRIKCAR